MNIDRRRWMLSAAGTATAAGTWQTAVAGQPEAKRAAKSSDLKITGLRITPIALPDPPLLFAGGCHGPYFLRNVIELETDAGIVGIGETHGGNYVTSALEKCRELIVGKSAFAYRSFAQALKKTRTDAYAGIELACLDAIGRATGRRLCELLGGPIHEKVEFAAYLFYRYAADHPKLLSDPRMVDKRGSGRHALDKWGEVRTPEAMAEMAWKFHKRWGFRFHKLKAGVLPPDVELETMHAINDRFGGKHPLRIDPNGRWSMKTALRIGKKLKELPLEYYEDPVRGQEAMAEVRQETGLKTSTNSCVTRMQHIPEAVKTQPVDYVLCDHHGWGGITACQALGEMAEVLGWTLSQHSNNHCGITMAAMAHVGAVVPQLTCASDTHYPWLVEGSDIIEGKNLPIKDGCVEVPKAPGVGVELDRDKLARAHEIYNKSGVRRRDDKVTMRRIVPDFKDPLW